jgi:hypothetical protein
LCVLRASAALFKLSFCFFGSWLGSLALAVISQAKSPQDRLSAWLSLWACGLVGSALSRLVGLWLVAWLQSAKLAFGFRLQASGFRLQASGLKPSRFNIGEKIS